MRVMNEEYLSKLADYIKEYAFTNNGETPKLGEIMAYMNMSKGTAFRYVTELDRRKVIRYSGRNTLNVDGIKYAHSGYARLPILGMVVCGSPDEQEEHIEGYVAIPEEWIEGECFLLRAYGDSMVDIGVGEGDLVLVKKATEAADGQVIVALTEDGNTLKRIFWENDKPRLHAENKTYPESKQNIYPESLVIQGIALKVIKDIH